MTHDTELPALIDGILDRRYADPGPFDDFTRQLQKLGIIRFSFDAFTNQLHFYTKTDWVHSHLRRDILSEQPRAAWTLGQTFDSVAIEQALAEFDANRISPMELHKRLYAASVVFCNVFLTTRTIFYHGADGQYFKECY